MTTVVLWLWLASGTTLLSQSVYTPEDCVARAKAMVESGEALLAQCVETQDA